MKFNARNCILTMAVAASGLVTSAVTAQADDIHIWSDNVTYLGYRDCSVLGSYCTLLFDRCEGIPLYASSNAVDKLSNNHERGIRITAHLVNSSNNRKLCDTKG